MKKRNIFVVGLYCLLSLGIYYLVWAWQLHKDLKAKGYRLFPFIFFGVPYLLFFIAIYYIFGVAIFQGTQDDIGLILVIVLLYAFLILMALLATFVLAWQIRFGKALRQETQGLVSLKLNLITFYIFNISMAVFLPAFIFWPMLIQHRINRHLARNAELIGEPILSDATRGVGYGGS